MGRIFQKHVEPKIETMKKTMILIASTVLSVLALNAQNLLINGDFEAGTLQPWWVFVDASAAAAVVDSSNNSVNYAEISNPGSNTYDIQLIQELSEDQIAELGDNINKTYYLTFDAIVPEERNCNLFLGEIGGSWTNLANGIVFTFVPEQTTYSASIKITQVFDAMKFGLEIGISSVPVEFDNFMLSMETPISVDHIQPGSGKYKIFPNPATEMLNVTVMNGTLVSLYSLTGLLIESKTAVLNSVKFDISDLNSGIYLISIQFDNSGVIDRISIP